MILAPLSQPIHLEQVSFIKPASTAYNYNIFKNNFRANYMWLVAVPTEGVRGLASAARAAGRPVLIYARSARDSVRSAHPIAHNRLAAARRALQAHVPEVLV